MKIIKKGTYRKEPSLIRNVLKLKPECVIVYPKLISRLELKYINAPLIIELAKTLKLSKDFAPVLNCLAHHNMEHFYIVIFIRYILTNRSRIIDFERYCYLKDGKDSLHRLIEISGSNEDTLLDYTIAFNNYDLIYFNLSYFIPDVIKYVSPERISLYNYFNVARFCCENNFENIKYVKKEIFKDYERYYYGLMYYIHLLNDKTYTLQNVESKRFHTIYYPVQGDCIELFINHDIANFNHLHMKHINENRLTVLTIAISQCFGFKYITEVNDNKVKLFKFNDELLLSSRVVNNVIDLVFDYMSK